MAKRSKRRLSKRALRRRRARRIRLLCMSCLLILFGCMVIFTVRAFTKPIEIQLQAQNAEITQGDVLPELTAKASYEGRTKKVLNKDDDYTIQDLLNDLNAGKGYELMCDGDTSIDNSYPITISYTEDFKKKLGEKWASRVKIITHDGTLTVKNQAGQWEGNDKFKLNDGSYVTSNLLSSNGNTYYFDENGEKVTGEYKVGLKTCTFDENGVLTGKGDAAIDPAKPMVALTFDDGPGERTMELLSFLDKYNSHATFFMQGVNAVNRPDAIKKMVEVGCELGNHSYNHKDLATLSTEGIQSQVNKTNAIIKEACGQTATVLRPPYGSFNSKVASAVGMPMILWSIDTLDWMTHDADATVKTTLESIKDGDIVLLHDVHTTSVDAAFELIPELIKQGYQLVNVSELAQAKGVTMENGSNYGSF